MQHLTCIDVDNKSTEQKYSMNCNTDYKTTAFSVYSHCQFVWFS